MAAHIACRPAVGADDTAAGCFVVCGEHDLRHSFGFAHAVARAACIEHNALHHPDRVVPATPLLSLIYESHATSAFDDGDLDRLLSSARRRNRAFGVTGMLLAEDGWFLQALEGPAVIVENLMRTIRRDPRHSHVQVLAREQRRERRFPDWAMARGHIGEVESLPLAEYYEALLAARAEDLRDVARSPRRRGGAVSRT